MNVLFVSVFFFCTSSQAIATNCEVSLKKGEKREKLNNVLDCLQTKIDQGIPPGVVAAFDLDKCPKGWTAFKNAEGRLIVGTGNNGNGNKDQNGKVLTARNLRIEGGEEVHTLTAPEMPSHSHGGVTASGSYNAAHLETKDSQNLPQGRAGIANTGGSLPHNNMPPFIALTYCEKL